MPALVASRPIWRSPVTLMVLLFSVAVPPKILKFCGDILLPVLAVNIPLVKTAKSPPIVVCVPEREAV